MRDVLRILEAAYPTDDGDVAWLDWLSAAVREHAGILNDGVFAQIYDASSGSSCDFGLTGKSGVGEDIVSGLFGQKIAPYYNEHPELIRAAFLSLSFSLATEIPGMDRHPDLRSMLDDAGVGEVVGLNASSPSGRGVIVCILVRRSLRLSYPTRALFGRVAGHVAAANRLRMRLAERGGPASVDTADAVLDSDGSVKHAVRGARVPEARARLAAAAVALSRARGRPHGDHRRARLGVVEGAHRCAMVPGRSLRARRAPFPPGPAQRPRGPSHRPPHGARAPGRGPRRARPGEQGNRLRAGDCDLHGRCAARARGLAPECAHSSGVGERVHRATREQGQALTPESLRPT